MSLSNQLSKLLRPPAAAQGALEGVRAGVVRGVTTEQQQDSGSAEASAPALKSMNLCEAVRDALAVALETNPRCANRKAWALASRTLRACSERRKLRGATPHPPAGRACLAKM